MVINGQLAIWDIEIKKFMEEVSKKETIQKSKGIVQNEKAIVSEILKEYPGAERVVEFSGRILVKLEKETIHISKAAGEVDFKTDKFPPIPYTAEILFSKFDEEVNEIQKEVLKDFKIKNKVEKVIKRFGDKNYIVITKDKTIAINPSGWIIDFKGQAKYKEDEVIPVKTKIEVGDTVEVEFKGVKHIGKVCRIYGPGNCTINVVYDKKHTTWYKDYVRLVG